MLFFSILASMFGHPLLKYVFRFGGPIALLAAIFFYYELSEFEREGGTYRTHVIFVWLYENLGIWGVVGSMLVASAAWFFLSVRHYLLKKNGKVVDGKNPSGYDNMWC
ncbi:MAG: hypothetical protein HYZ14_11535 [Bacteroidetes bacterium]|nr:hypothetical protein [Bacteroidota bacterium]